MKAVILAAGMGTRLWPVTKDLPKGLIEIDGKSILERSLENLMLNGITEVIIVIGHCENLVIAKIGEKYNNMAIRYVYNGDYPRTGSMYSFSKTKSLINEDILLLESDILYESSAIKRLIESKHKNVILVSNLLLSGDDVYVVITDNLQLLNLGKNISEKDKQMAVGALVGISKFSKEFLAKVFETADEDYAKNELNYHYEECVLKTSRIAHPVYVEMFEGLNWIEIDNEQDLKRAIKDIYPKIYK